jgi:ABC-type nitrate/sulfonate/bicarbonate transport system substrate-binding protein
MPHGYVSSLPRSYAKHLLYLLLAILGSAMMSAPPAQAQTKLKMVLNWKYQGPQGWFFLADDRGYFKAEGLEMVMDQGTAPARACRSSPTARMTLRLATSMR